MEPDNSSRQRRSSSGRSSAMSARVNFIDILIAQGFEFCKTANDTIRNFLHRLQLTEVIDSAGDVLAEHPVLGFTLLAMALSCGLPVIVFIIFAVISVIFTFAGFIFVEGTILAVGCLLLFGGLLVMVLVMSMMAIILTGLYFTVVRIGTVVNSSEHTKIFMNHMVPLLTGTENNEFEPRPTLIQDANQD